MTIPASNGCYGFTNLHGDPDGIRQMIPVTGVWHVRISSHTTEYSAGTPDSRKQYDGEAECFPVIGWALLDDDDDKGRVEPLFAERGAVTYSQDYRIMHHDCGADEDGRRYSEVHSIDVICGEIPVQVMS